jgi:DNA-directed RNA polymerase subunit RPC12/RpoP
MRTALAQPEEMVRYSCPRCKKSLESPVSLAGQKFNCTGCGQRIQIPQPPKPPEPAVNKTMLGDVDSLSPPPSALPAPSRGPANEVPVVQAVQQPARRESCLECGRDITGRDRLLTCPDCGSLFCSSMCFRDHRAHAHPRQKKRVRARERRLGFRCPFCGTEEPPYWSQEISAGGWTLFAVMLVSIVLAPLCWIGLLITEERRNCADCGMRLN